MKLPAPWPLRLPVIRHARWLWHRRRVWRNAAEWFRAGVGTGVPDEYDMGVLDLIRRGKI